MSWRPGVRCKEWGMCAMRQRSGHRDGGERWGWVWVAGCLVVSLWSLARHSFTTPPPPHLRSCEGVGELRRGRREGEGREAVTCVGVCVGGEMGVWV